MSLPPHLRIRPKREFHTWRICPYSTCDTVTGKVPTAEQSIHTTTSGYMKTHVKSGHDGLGFICLDNACSFFQGTATTEVVMQIRNQTLDRLTNSYSVSLIDVPIPVCSGTRFFEK